VIIMILCIQCCFSVQSLTSGSSARNVRGCSKAARLKFICAAQVFVLPSTFQHLTSLRFDTAQPNGLGSQDTSKQQIVIDNMALTINAAR